MGLVCAQDSASWGVTNRVRLYPDQAQTWILATVLDRGEPSDQELRRQARAVMAKWFSDAPVTDVGSSRSGAASDIEVGPPTATYPVLTGVTDDRVKLPGPLPLLRAGRVVYVPVRFAWRSRETSRAWPTRRVAWGLGAPCHVDADWMLMQVGNVQPAGPEAPSLLDHPLDVIGAAIFPPIAWIGVGVALFGVGYLLSAARR